MRIGKPPKYSVGYESKHGPVVRISHGADGHVRYIIRCVHCGEEHGQNVRSIATGAWPRACPKYKPHNYSGLERNDGIMRRVYGISLADYAEILNRQGGGCAICGATKDTAPRRLSVNHCHKSGKVRGILCSPCNKALGLFMDDPERLSRASKYLSNAR